MSTIINTRAGRGNDYVRVALDTLEARLDGYVGGMPVAGKATSVTPGADGEANIAHGCATVPTSAIVSLGGDVAAVFVDVVSIDSTNVRVRFKDGAGADKTTGTYTVHWVVNAATDAATLKAAYATLPTFGSTGSLSPNGSGEATITHGQGTTPTIGIATLVGDVAAVFVDVISVGATLLTVRFKDAAGADKTTGTYTVNWMVK